MSLSTINISPILREMGDSGWDQKMLVNAHPLMAQIETDTNGMSGDYFKIPVPYAKPAGRSALSTVAYDNEAGSKKQAFKLTPVSDYMIFRIDGEVVRRAAQANDETSFANAVKVEVAEALEQAGDNIAKTAYGNNGGARGQVHPTIAPVTTTLTLAKKSNTVFFYPGMYVTASATDGTTGSLLDAGDRVLVNAVSLSAGTLTGNTNWSGISGIAVGNYLFAEGDFGLAPAGLEAWNPATAPGATLFYSVDRSVSPDFLGGMRYDGAALGDSMETVFIQSDSLFALQVGNPFKDAEIYINPLSLGTLRIAKESQRFIDTDNEYGIGIKKFRTPSGHVLVEDRDCPQGVARVIGKGCFKHYTNGVQPNFAENDGVEMRYDDRTDKYTGTFVIDHNFGSPKPQGLGRINLPTA